MLHRLKNELIKVSEVSSCNEKTEVDMSFRSWLIVKKIDSKRSHIKIRFHTNMIAGEKGEHFKYDVIAREIFK